jgi:hypothetical protein
MTHADWLWTLVVGLPIVAWALGRLCTRLDALGLMSWRRGAPNMGALALSAFFGIGILHFFAPCAPQVRHVLRAVKEDESRQDEDDDAGPGPHPRRWHPRHPSAERGRHHLSARVRRPGC